MVWAGISSTGRTELVILQGNLNGRRYIDEVLRPHVIPYLNQMGVVNPIFQDDNATPHRARMVQDYLTQNGIQRMDWPPMSRDLACIEHVWDILGRAVTKRIGEHTRLADLPRILRQEWALIPQQKIRNLVNSMRRRVLECLAHNGGYTHY